MRIAGSSVGDRATRGPWSALLFDAHSVVGACVVAFVTAADRARRSRVATCLTHAPER